jgi:thiamine biosynthesis lipoprotein
MPTRVSLYFLIIGGLFSLFLSPSVEAKSVKTLCQYDYKIPSMGTVFEIQLVSRCGQEHKELTLEAKNILELWEREFSLYQSQSPIQVLNRTKKLSAVSPQFREGLDLSIEAHQRTDGKFNILVGPVLALVRASFKEHKGPPTNENIDRLRPSLDIENLIIEKNSVSLKGPEAQITLDGIVKGIAVDKVRDLMTEFEISHFLLNFSGNMVWKGQPLDKKSWSLKAWNPVLQKTFDIKIPEEGAIASSGPEHNSFDEKWKWHHLIDPKTLRPSLHWMQTTVITTNAKDADVLSTALFVSNESEIKKILKNYPGTRVYLVKPDGKVISL